MMWTVVLVAVLSLFGWVCGTINTGNPKAVPWIALSPSRLMKKSQPSWHLNESFYRAAVYEHRTIAPRDPSIVLSRQDALDSMKRNLAIFSKQAHIAAYQGSLVIVFPEYGLYGLDQTRETIRPYLEPIPDPDLVSWNPCIDPNPHSEVQHILSCMARGSSIYIVANMGEISQCTSGVDGGCPPDGYFQFNTNVVYDHTGNFLVRYRKQHMYQEQWFDASTMNHIAIFQTPAGLIGTFICADVIYKSPAVDIVKEYGIVSIAFPTAWTSNFPYAATIEAQQGYAVSMKVNLLASNVHFPKDGFLGSGIYSASGAITYSYDTESEQGRLLMADVPINPSLKYAQPSMKTHSTQKRDNSIDTLKRTNFQNTTFSSKMVGDEVTFKIIENNNGSEKICMGDLCCFLKYSFSYKSSKEIYAFGVWQGIHTKYLLLYNQICTVVKCKSTDKYTCGKKTLTAESSFSHLELRGNFQAEAVYPYLLTVENSQINLAVREYDYSGGTLTSRKGFSKPFLSVVLFGRYFSKDPKF